MMISEQSLWGRALNLASARQRPTNVRDALYPDCLPSSRWDGRRLEMSPHHRRVTVS